MHYPFRMKLACQIIKKMCALTYHISRYTHQPPLRPSPFSTSVRADISGNLPAQ